ncbi:hypothetical protein B0H12DRAFT_1245410 [Mycena haematopus]|nr:hypothetical protein B0H12DRAFT_1245410 [Mycena haematopus]
MSPKSLSDYIQDDATRQSMVQETQKWLKTIRVIPQALERVYELLEQVDAKNYKGAGMKFAPAWKGSIEKFGSLIGSTEMWISNGKVCIDTFTERILPLIESTTMKAEANIYVSVMDQTDQQLIAIDALLAAYGGISDEVSHSKSTFEQRMIQVSPLTIDIQSAKPDMDYIKEQLGLFRDSAKIFQNLWVVVFRILGTVKEADDWDIPDIRNVEIERVAKSYASLAVMLDTFASG